MSRSWFFLLCVAALETTVALLQGAAEPSAPVRPPPSRGALGSPPILPDPALLDGAAHPPEKRSAVGMVGEFELPGDEGAKAAKAGGVALPPSQNGAESDRPSAGGGPGEPGSQGGPEAANKGAKAPETPPAGAGGQAQGLEVVELKGDARAPAPDAQGPSRPSIMAIGDQAMRIPQQPGNPAVVGTQQVANVNTQDYEKGTGTGGKGPVNKGGPNRTEKGRVIPSGL